VAQFPHRQKRTQIPVTALHPRLAPRLHRVDADDAVAVLRRLSALTHIAGMLPSIREEDVLLREVVMAMAIYFDRPRMVRMFLADSEGAATLGYEYVAGAAVNRIDVAGVDALAPAHRDLFLAPLRLAPSMKGAGTIISAPLLEGTSLLGLLLVEGTAEMNLDSTELDTLAGIAAQASMAIQHVRSTGRLHARRHLERDLSVARRIQQSFLPKLPERIERFRIAAHYAPAYQIGGDFYDVLPQSGGRLLLTMGDVSGKGVSGALLMARATSELRRISATEASPARVLTEMDRALSGQICDDTFVTAACVSIDSARGVATVANAGHVLPLLRRASGEVITFGNPSGPPLAMVGLTEYADEMIQVAPGDILLLMTDGILDALHTDEDPLGMAALEALVRKMPPDIFDINRRILRAVEERNCLRADDITLLAVELLP
jgi:serine phosphatase RsbU (regulator of sigma subunit)